MVEDGHEPGIECVGADHSGLARQADFLAQEPGEKILEHRRAVEIGGLVKAVAPYDVDAQIGREIQKARVQVVLPLEVGADQVGLLECHQTDFGRADKLQPAGEALADAGDEW